MVLAIDPANTTGFAIGDGVKNDYGVWQLKRPGAYHPDKRLVILRDELATAIEQYGITFIAFEDASFGSPSQHVKALHNELRGVIRLVAAERNIPCRGYKPTTIKAFATGSGRADKPQMVRAAKTILGLDTEDDNIADAAFILQLALRDADKPPPPAAWDDEPTSVLTMRIPRSLHAALRRKATRDETSMNKITLHWLTELVERDPELAAIVRRVDAAHEETQAAGAARRPVA
jgi:Holliday junction resolvasome RuvABC endonuclease subunit